MPETCQVYRERIYPGSYDWNGGIVRNSRNRMGEPQDVRVVLSCVAGFFLTTAKNFKVVNLESLDAEWLGETGQEASEEKGAAEIAEVILREALEEWIYPPVSYRSVVQDKVRCFSLKDYLVSIDSGEEITAEDLLEWS